MPLDPRITRRDVLKASLPAALALTMGPRSGRAQATADALPPVRQITHGPKFHWFGYYDKLQLDATGRYALQKDQQSSPLAFKGPKMSKSGKNSGPPPPP